MIAAALQLVVGCRREPPAPSEGPATSQQPNASEKTTTAKAPPEASYLDRLAAFQTKLVRHGPAPQPYDPDLAPPPGVSAVTYTSEGRALKAWIAYPPGATPAAKVPGVVYLHGGFAFAGPDFEDARPFLEAGFALLCPTLRGENGNPGDHELYFGEVRDAKAAVAWFAAQDRVDAKRIYTFGHSAGGILSSLLSLHDVPIRHGGSAGGLYGPEMFDWDGLAIPFDPAERRERALRLLLGNARWMKRPHYAWAGDGDRAQRVAAARVDAKGSGGLLHVAVAPGDHHSSLAPAVAAYIDVIRAEP